MRHGPRFTALVACMALIAFAGCAQPFHRVSSGDCDDADRFDSRRSRDERHEDRSERRGEKYDRTSPRSDSKCKCGSGGHGRSFCQPSDGLYYVAKVKLDSAPRVGTEYTFCFGNFKWKVHWPNQHSLQSGKFEFVKDNKQDGANVVMDATHIAMGDYGVWVEGQYLCFYVKQEIIAKERISCEDLRLKSGASGWSDDSMVRVTLVRLAGGRECGRA